MKHLAIMLLLFGAVAGVSYAQTNDTVSENQQIHLKDQATFVTDTVNIDSILMARSMRMLKGVKITADRPLYSVDGEKQLYNTSDDPSVQTGSASDALQNAPGVEVDAEGNITLRGSQSVDVWINDRPSHLSGEALKQYIKTLPANAIERIEVITNPSARYGGGGPVVNIVTRTKIKRNEFVSFGANGNARPQISPWASYVYGGKRFSLNIYGEYDYAHTWSDMWGSNIILTPQGDTSATRDYSTHEDHYKHGGYLWVNGHYEIDTQRTVSFYGSTYPSLINYDGTGEHQWHEYIYAPGNYSYSSTSHYRTPQIGAYGGVDYTRRINQEGEQFWLRLGANTFSYNSSHSYMRTYYTLVENDLTILDSTQGNNGIRSWFESGYTLPLSKKWELEVGIGGGRDFPSNYVTSSDSLIVGSVIRDPIRCYSNTESGWKYLAYATLLRRFGDLTVKLGMQAGRKHEEGSWNGYTTAKVDQSWTIPVPSIHLTYHTKNMHNFALSWTRRVSNPEASDLTPFINYNFESFNTGNPNLKLSVSNNVECSWNKYYDGFGSVGAELYWRANQNAISSLTDVAFNDFFGREVSFSMPYNIGNTDLAGTTLNVTYRPTAFINVRLSAYAFNYHYRLMFRPDEWAEDAAWAGSLRLNAWAKLWNVLQLFGNVGYSTRQISVLNSSEPSFRADLGLGADLMDRKLSLYLNVKDIFNSYASEWNNTNPYYSGSSRSTSSSRYISLGFVLRFGKLELENQARKREE